MGSKGTKRTYFRANFISFIHDVKMGSRGHPGVWGGSWPVMLGRRVRESSDHLVQLNRRDTRGGGWGKKKSTAPWYADSISARWSPLICLVHTGRAIPLSPELSLTQALQSISYSRCKFFQGTILSQAASFELLALWATILHSAEGWLRREMLVRSVLKVPVWQRQLVRLVFSSGSLGASGGGALPDDQ